MPKLEVQPHRRKQPAFIVLMALLTGSCMALAMAFLPAEGFVFLAWVLQGIALPMAVYHWSGRKDWVGHLFALIVRLSSGLLGGWLYRSACGWIQHPAFVARFGSLIAHCSLVQIRAGSWGGFWTLFPAAFVGLVVWYDHRLDARLLLPRYNHFYDSPIRQVWVDLEAKRA